MFPLTRGRRTGLTNSTDFADSRRFFIVFD
jgi:hypothetical protein